MTVGIATDHHGVVVKKELISYLEQREYQVINYGSDSEDPVDYPLYAFSVGEAIQKGEIDFGILICGSGIGMSIACNKVKGVRCAKVNTSNEAMYSRLHNDANVIALSASSSDILEIIDAFLSTDFSSEERHHRRVEQINHYGC